MKTLEQEVKEYIRQEKHKNQNKYHQVGLVSHQQRIETKDAFMKWFLDIEPTFFITFVYNRKFHNPNVEQVVSYGKDKLNKFHKYIHKKLLGKYWYKPEIINPKEHIEMVLLPQKIKSNLHFHGIVNVKNTKMFPKKVKMFLEYSSRLWNLDRELSTGNRDVIVPSGSVCIERPNSINKVSWYSTRDQDKYENYEHYYISGSK
jgi:hypothetical protein